MPRKLALRLRFIRRGQELGFSLKEIRELLALRVSPKTTSAEIRKRAEAKIGEPFINQILAYHALAMLARLFRHEEIGYHGGFVNLASGRMAPLL